ncbi:hypothetical protein B4144_0357 [Bacillus atrophaeus]|nr:hypothetical protein B4144_0357 [Bacillus atrophaeus]
MNAKVFLLPPLPENEPLQIYNPFAKIYDPQNGSVISTMSVRLYQ